MTDDKGALARTVDSHGGIHYKDEAAAARHIVRQNVKDKDALEELKRLAHDLVEGGTVRVGAVSEAIAAWEKERALSEERRKALVLYHESDALVMKVGEREAALRAAVERAISNLRAIAGLMWLLSILGDDEP